MQRFCSLSLFLLCLTLPHMKAETDVATEFGKEFGNELKTLTRQLGEKYIQAAQELYEKILANQQLDSEDEESIRKSLTNLAEIKPRLASNDARTVFAALRDFIAKERAQLRFYAWATVGDSGRPLEPPFKEWFDDTNAATVSYIASINEKYKDLLMRLPRTEFDKHPELVHLYLRYIKPLKRDLRDFSNALEEISEEFRFYDWEISSDARYLM